MHQLRGLPRTFLLLLAVGGLAVSGFVPGCGPEAVPDLAIRAARNEGRENGCQQIETAQTTARTSIPVRAIAVLRKNMPIDGVRFPAAQNAILTRGPRSRAMIRGPMLWQARVPQGRCSNRCRA